MADSTAPAPATAADGIAADAAPYGFDLSSLSPVLEAEAAHRERVKTASRELERTTRALSAVVRRVHSRPPVSSSSSETVLDPSLRNLYLSSLGPVREKIAAVAELIPHHEFYRYNDIFSRTLQDGASSVLLVHFLEEDDLADVDKVALELGIDPTWRDRFFLQTEDYLHATISLLSDLSRLSLNAVTRQDYLLPVRIAQFANELSSAFALLNLKNDSLRKRSDGVKYDVKKIEEVIYDLSLRGLIKHTASEGTSVPAPSTFSSSVAAAATAASGTGGAMEVDSPTRAGGAGEKRGNEELGTAKESEDRAKTVRTE